MKKTLGLIALTFLTATTIFAESIKDVPSDEIGYKAMNNTVKKGYLSLYPNNAFRPNQTLTRKEFALAIDALSSDLKDDNLSLSPSDIQELNNLSKSFKGNFTGISEQIAELIKTQAVHSDEIKTLHHDLSQTDDELRQTDEQLKQDIAKLKKERLYTWIGIGISVLLGVAR